MKKKSTPKQLVIYQTKYGAIELRGDFAQDTIWATQAQIAVAFEVDVRTINEHITNIYKTKELIENLTIRKFRIVQKEGKREVQREILHYNLDAILSVGYRVNSKRATLFRQWATKTLRSYIVDGYAINRSRITKHYGLYQKAVEHLERIVPNTTIDTKSVLDLIKLFSRTWISLDAYDKSELPKSGATKKQVRLTTQDIVSALVELKAELMKKNEATELFTQIVWK